MFFQCASVFFYLTYRLSKAKYDPFGQDDCCSATFAFLEVTFSQRCRTRGRSPGLLHDATLVMTHIHETRNNLHLSPSSQVTYFGSQQSKSLNCQCRECKRFRKKNICIYVYIYIYITYICGAPRKFSFHLHCARLLGLRPAHRDPCHVSATSSSHHQETTHE